jgi:hypothetical protein
MKMSVPLVRLFAGIGFAASLFLGCESVLDQSGDSNPGQSTPTDDAALRLSIKDDSVCREQWSAILAARGSGRADTLAEAGFLTSCVKEVKPTGKGVVPVIPANLVPDSNTRCHWIVSQIEAGRNEMTVSYKRYCPEDCRKLEYGDSSRHEKYCHDPVTGPGKDTVFAPGKDTGYVPGKPPKDTSGGGPTADSCKSLLAYIGKFPPGDSVRAQLERGYAARCKERFPVDSLPVPPKDSTYRNPWVDTCKALYSRILYMKAGDSALPELQFKFNGLCPELLGVPRFTPVKDTVVPPRRNPYEDTCRMLKEMLATVKPGDSGRAMLEHMYAGMCKVFIPIDSLPKPGKDTVVLPDPYLDTCKLLYGKLGLAKPGEPGRADLERLYAAKCKEPHPVILPVPVDTLPKQSAHDSICADLKMHAAGATPGTAEHAGFEQKFKVTCLEPRPAAPAGNPCGDLRAKLSELDPASPDYPRMKEYVAGVCKG